MTLKTDGWLNGRPFAVVTDRDTGEVEKFIDIRTGHETVPDAEVFKAMDWTEIERKMERPAEVPLAPPPPKKFVHPEDRRAAPRKASKKDKDKSTPASE